MTASESKGRFFSQNESIQIVNWNALPTRLRHLEVDPQQDQGIRDDAKTKASVAQGVASGREAA